MHVFCELRNRNNCFVTLTYVVARILKFPRPTNGQVLNNKQFRYLTKFVILLTCVVARNFRILRPTNKQV